MSTELEIAFHKSAREKVNLGDCKECKFFSLEEGKPHCEFDSPHITDCRIIVLQLHLTP